MSDGKHSSSVLTDFHADEKRWDKSRPELERHDVKVEIPEHRPRESYDDPERATSRRLRLQYENDSSATLANLQVRY